MKKFEWILKILRGGLNIILGIIYLCEEKINYYHSNKKLMFVILINLFLITMVDIIISLFTYLLLILSSKKIILSFTSLLILYFIILGIITFKNLLHKDFNLASKIKLLILSIFDELNIKRIFEEFIFCICVWLALMFLLTLFMYKYIIENNVNNINFNTSLGIILLAASITTLIIYVYGSNDMYISYKRKLLLYSVSTIITLITTLDSLKDIYNNPNVDIVNFKFMTLIFTLIMSIDRCITSYTNLIKEYKNKSREFIEKRGEELLKQINSIAQSFNIKKYFILFIQLIKQICLLYKLSDSKKKREIIIFLLSSLVIIIGMDKFMPFILMKIGNFLDGILSNFLDYIFYNVKFEYYNELSFLGSVIRFIFKFVLVILLIVGFINCIKYIITSILNIKKILQTRITLKKKIDWIKLRKELWYLFQIWCLFIAIIIIPLGFTKLLDNKLTIFIINLLAYISLIIIILCIACTIFNGIQNKINQYNEN
ncbi:hypothetical protein [uncultured Clostridium sp.]|uniref:hypothetical protein n=1 Tax=uncultured Clostridium sp. TaxID=59620 RepID=UPI0028E2811A|nr:hypothetical protein [uncultured Clostridium sp.]